MNILYITLEYSTWHGARSLSYSGQLALEEGFEANRLEYLTLPAIQGIPAHFPASWLFHAKRICAGRRFDQVWIELVHTDPGEEFLEWVATIAPVRVGLILESLEFDEAIYALHPPLRNRRMVVDSRLRYMTHALAVDEADAGRLNASGLVKALWWPQAVPERWIANPAPPASGQAVFGGASYPWRQLILDYPPLSSLLKKIPSPEAETQYPALFDAVNRHAISALNGGTGADGTMLAAYLSVLRSIRRECFSLWLNNLSSGPVIVNLPGYIRSYPGRVIEGMAAGRPVISAEVPDRPRTRALFKEGADILLFPQERPDLLERHILNLRNEPVLARQLADTARNTLWRFHTMEKRVGQILWWIRTGTEPSFEEEPLHEGLTEALKNFQAAFGGSGPLSVPQPPLKRDLENQMAMVSAALQQRDAAGAIHLLEQVVHLEPHCSEMLMSLCRAGNDLEKAALYNMIAIANSTPSIDLLIAGCEIAERQKNDAAGFGFLKEAFRLHPSGPQLERLLQFRFGQDK